MATVASHLDYIQGRLHDGGSIWTREELLNWFNDGYRRLTVTAQHAKTFSSFALPPRHSFARTQEWEPRHTFGGTHRKFTIAHDSSRMQGTVHWEVESAHGLEATIAFQNVTQLWELSAATDEVNQHYRLYFPATHDRVLALWWDHRRLEPISVRELDYLEDAWWRVQGQPYFWTEGLGRDRTVEIYEIETEYRQDYHLVNFEQGAPRRFSGDRTYAVSATGTWDYAYTADGEPQTQSVYETGLTGVGYRFTLDATNTYHGTQVWEPQTLSGDTVDPGTSTVTSVWEQEFQLLPEFRLGLGLIRSIDSTLRQYWPVSIGQLNGIVRRIGSSEEAILMWHTVLPELLTEEDTPHLLPRQLEKYLRYYTLLAAFNRQGEGIDLNLALHYQSRFGRGGQLLRRLANITYRDEEFMREPVAIISRQLPRPQLPSNFARAAWLR
jgi:hypothetical protein